MNTRFPLTSILESCNLLRDMLFSSKESMPNLLGSKVHEPTPRRRDEDIDFGYGNTPKMMACQLPTYVLGG